MSDLDDDDIGSTRLALPERCTIPGPEHRLEALFTPGGKGAGAVVASPHPLYGGTMSNAVVIATGRGLHAAGLATFAFNYRGTEESQGTASDSLESAVEDYAAVLAELRRRTGGPYVAAGYSFGAGTALLTARDDAQICGVVLVAPPIGLLLAEDLAAFQGRVLIVVGEHDDYAPLQELEARCAARADCVLEVIAGADHFFHFGGLPELEAHIKKHVAGWL
ncbi:MAG: alpha/beta fold hydrolase [Polyangiales bacterium]